MVNQLRKSSKRVGWLGLRARCAPLHNYIVEVGWTQRGLELDVLDKRSWWECHGGYADIASKMEFLVVFVVFFLKAAWHGFAMEATTIPDLSH